MKVSTPAAPPAPTPVSPGESVRSYMEAMADPVLQGQILAAEQQFRPQYTELNLADLNNYLYGTGGQEGTVGLLGRVSQDMAAFDAAALQRQREADIAAVEQLGPRAAEAFRAANPQLQAALGRAEGLSSTQNFYGGLQQALSNQPQFQNVNFSAANAAMLGAAPQASSQGYTAQNAAQVNNVSAGQVGSGALGEQLMQQALGAGGVGQVGGLLQGRAADLAQSRGQLNADELRSLQQATREAYAARGVEMGSGALSAEALSRLTNERQRMQEDLALASALNQAGQSELAANRAFQQGVQGADVSRQFSNVGNNLQAALANQGVSAQQALANQQAANQAAQFGASAANTSALANQAMAGQYGLANQSAANQFALANQQADLSTQAANRAFAANQYQQMVANQGLLGQLQASQLGQDRNYALQLAGLTQSTMSDPFQAILGRPSQALGMAQNQQGFGGSLVSGLQGPQLFDPNAGINLALQNNANLSNFNTSIYGSQLGFAGAQAGAQGQMIGGLLGGLGGIGAGVLCWVARECFGADNPKWLEFRDWLLNDAPSWFRWLYVKYGERFAAWIKNKPRLKKIIRKWMENRINSWHASAKA